MNSQNPEEEKMRREENGIDTTIQVRRVPDHMGYEEEFYEDNYEEEDNLDIDTNNYGEADDLREESQELEDESPWNNEENNDMRFASGEMPESASVLSLQYPQQETLITNEEWSQLSPESFGEEEKTPAECKTLRFFPASASRIERSRSAPPRPLTDIEEFRGSNEYSLLEKAAMDSNDLVFKSDGKLELDTVDGQSRCKAFLQDIEALALQLNIVSSKRKYRLKFSQAYRVLYQEGTLCYLTEILDSAQEGFPYIIVNSEKYIFSPNVLRSGERLFNSFMKLKETVKDIYNNAAEDFFEKGVKLIMLDLKEELQDFDSIWTIFEKLYIFELMLIEKDARRYILKAIQIEQELKSLEIRERLKGKIVIRSPIYEKLRKKMISICCTLNSVSNTAGKGRDDFTIEILQSAEDVLRKISEYKSKAVRRLAEKIKSTFMSFRQLFRKYSENIEVIDPQLKNNTDLSETLLALEKAWEKGKEFLLNKKQNSMLISFSQQIESLQEKYPEIQEKIEAMDADIFMMIPCLAILKSLDDPSFDLYNFFGSEADLEEYALVLSRYEALRNDPKDFKVYNLLERIIINDSTLEVEISALGLDPVEIHKLIHDVKGLSIPLQRSKPSEWNSFLETAMGIV